MQFKPFKIGKFLLLERIATGGMAEVYRAKASGAGGFEKQLAIKRIIPTYAQNEEFRRMFEYEARLSSLLNQANIVHVYDFVKSGDTYLLALEFVDGKNLRQVVNKAKKIGFTIPIEFGIYVINEVCKGLDYAHKMRDGIQGKHLNIIHRDMSPQNIMISYDGAVKIVDFGIAKARDRVDETRSGVIKGKFGYMSPEQASGEEIDHRSDIFSTAIILYEMLTGKRLFAAENDMATLKRIQECIVQRPSLVNPKITSQLEKVVLKGLTKDRNLRYQDAGTFHQKLQEYLNKYFPSYTQKNVALLMQKLFQEEILQEKQRLEQVYRQSIPYSQGAPKEQPEELAGIAAALDGDETKSEHEPDSVVTRGTGLSARHQEPAHRPAEERPAPAQEGSVTLPRRPVGSEPKEPPVPGSGPSQLDSEDQATANYLIDDDPDSGTVGEVSISGGEDEESGVTLPRGGPFSGPAREEESEGTPETKIRKETTGSYSEANPKVETSLRLVTDARAPGPAPSQEPIIRDDEAMPGDEESIVTSVDGPGTGGFQLSEDPRQLPPDEAAPRLGALSREFRETPQTSPFFGAGTPGGRDMDFDPTPAGPSVFARIGRALFSVIVLTGLAGTLYYYFLIEEPAPGVRVPSSPERSQTPSPAPETKSAEPRNLDSLKLGQGCPIEIDSDPRGAAILLDGSNVGRTPTLLSVPCGRPAKIGLRLSEYEDVNEQVQPSSGKNAFYKTLKKIPLGRLELSLSQNAVVFVDDVRQPAEALRGVPYVLQLRAGKTYKLRFENNLLGLVTTKEYTVREAEVLRDRVRLFPTK